MSLPSEVKNTNGEITENGTVVYEAEGEDVRIAVQAISDEQDGSIFDAVRTMVTIENAEAPKEYSFTFNLPKGFSLIKDYDYEDEYDEWDCGAIYIVDENNRTVSVIDPAWAKNANGNDVETYYVIDGTTLVQHVVFDESCAFPIIADPTTHPDKYTKQTFDYTGVKKQYNLCLQEPSLASVAKNSANTAIAISGFCASLFAKYEVLAVTGSIAGMVGTAWAAVDLGDSIIALNKAKLWKRIMSNISSSRNKYRYVILKYRWRYHPGKKDYYPAGDLTLSYATANSREV